MLNGWQRLWVLMCVLWGALVVSIMFILSYTEDELGLADSLTWNAPRSGFSLCSSYGRFLA